jgi:predicted nucleic acid-binding protein
MSKVFIDTNILIYSFDTAYKDKQKKSRERLLELEETGQGVISTQIIQEFYVCAVKKLSMNPIVAKQIVARLDNFEVVTIDLSMINDAVDCSILNQISFWDALVIISAHQAKCDRIWTEDLSHGQIIKNIKIENIFKSKLS